MFTPVPPKDESEQQPEVVNQSPDEHPRTSVMGRVIVLALFWGNILGLAISFPVTLLARPGEAHYFRDFDNSRELFLTTFARTFTSFAPSMIFLIGLALMGQAIIDHILFANEQSTRQVRQISRWLRKNGPRE